MSAVELGELCAFTNGGTPSKAVAAYWNGHVPWITSADINDGAVSIGRSYVTDEGLENSAATQVSAGTILLVSRTGIGKVAEAPTSLSFSQDITAIEPKHSKLDRRYVVRFLEANKAHFERHARGATIKGITREAIAKLKIPLPPVAEQRRIAAILDKADALRRKRKRSLDLLQESTIALVAAYLDSGASGKSVELGEIITEGPTNGLYKPAADYGSGVPILRIDSFYDGMIGDIASLKRLRVTKDELTRFQLRLGDLVINRVNSLEYLGKSAIVPELLEPTVFESNMMRFAIDPSILLPEVCIALLQTPAIKRQILSKAKNAVNQSSINQGDVKSLRLPLPEMVEQRRFLVCATEVGMLRAKVARDGAALASLFSSLQSRAFSGQL